MVAIVTTLVVEYFAKPGLEVRKDRIMDTSRQQREHLRALRRCIFLCGRILALQDEQDIPFFRDRTVTMADELEPLLWSVQEGLEISDELADAWMDTFAVMAGAAAWLRNDVPPAKVWGQLDTASDRAAEFDDLLRIRRARWLRRRRVRSNILRWDRLNPDESPEPSH